MRVTVCQVDNRDGHRERALAALAEHARHSDLLLLPELALHEWLGTTPAVNPARWQVAVDAHAAGIGALAGFGVPAVIGTRPIVTADGSRRNQAFRWIAEAGAVALREKHYLPDEPGFYERTWYDPSDRQFPVCTVGEATVGVQICTELWFFEWARHYARAGAELLCVPRATPHASVRTWLAGGVAAAVCAGAFCLSSNLWSPPGGDTDLGGLGWIIDPDGKVLATTSEDRPFVTVDVDLEFARAAKKTYPRYVQE